MRTTSGKIGEIFFTDLLRGYPLQGHAVVISPKIASLSLFFRTTRNKSKSRGLSRRRGKRVGTWIIASCWEGESAKWDWDRVRGSNSRHPVVRSVFLFTLRPKSSITCRFCVRVVMVAMTTHSFHGCSVRLCSAAIVYDGRTLLWTMLGFFTCLTCCCYCLLLKCWEKLWSQVGCA